MMRHKDKIDKIIRVISFSVILFTSYTVRFFYKKILKRTLTLFICSCFLFPLSVSCINLLDRAQANNNNPCQIPVNKISNDEIFSVPADPINGIEKDGKKIGYGQGKDYTFNQESNNETKSDLKNPEKKIVESYEKSTTSDLEKILKKGISPGGNITETMVDLFMKWDIKYTLGIQDISLQQSTLTGVPKPVLRFETGSEISEEVNKSSEFGQVLSKVIPKIQMQLENELKKSDINPQNLCLTITDFPSINFHLLPDLSPLAFSIGGTQGRALFIKDFSKDENSYQVTLRFVIYDVFGVDENDLAYWNDWKSQLAGVFFNTAEEGSSGVVAQWILQHERTAKPYLEEIIVDVPITGNYEHGGSNNDPHLATFDGLRYDLQTVGEFILVKSNHGGFEIQARQTPFNNSGNISINSAVAMKVGSDRVAFYAQHFPDADTSNPLRVNGKPATIQGNKLTLNGGGEILKQGSTYVISSPRGEKVLVSPSGTGNNALFNVSPFVYKQSGTYSGLLGNVNGNPNDDQQIRGGGNILKVQSTYGDVNKVLNQVGLRLPGALDRAEKVYFDQLYKEFANSWRVKQKESLFDYPAGKTTKNYLDPSFPEQYLKLDMLSPEQIQKARNACTKANVSQDLMEGCIFDVGFSGFSEFAHATAEINGYVNIVNQLFPGLNIPTTGQLGSRVIEKVKPKICLPFIGCH